MNGRIPERLIKKNVTKPLDLGTKVLITISSWENAAVKGYHKAQRDTFLRHVREYPNLDYKFFIGDGSPTGEDESILDQSFTQVAAAHGDRYKYIKPDTYKPEPDEIVLHVPDDYKHNAYKTKGSHRWAIEHGYTHIFQCTSDTFIDIHRLMRSGFENHDYIGNAEGIYARGGNGYWLTSATSSLILDERVTLWAEDWWVGTVLTKKGIKLHHDGRYAERPDVPNKENQVISSHLGWPYFEVGMMYETYRLLH
jgi:hypothetical protein